ncbi:MAG: cobalamin-binding protein [Sterolibacterium sp.]
MWSESRFVVALLLLVSQFAFAQIAVQDDMGQTLRLATAARRIVSLAPHITENLYTAGAGAYIVGAVEYSDYPEAAKRLPRVGSYERLDLEAILALKPDLVIGWDGGNPAAILVQLKSLGLPLFLNRPRRLDDIANSIERFGELAGTNSVAGAAARAFRARHAELRKRQASLPPVRIFYQVWDQPLMTVSGEQLISDVMRLCGAENIFASLPTLAPTVTREAVLAANPEAIVASGMGNARPEWLDSWKRWGNMTAIARGNLFFIPADFIDRHSSRVLDGAVLLCEQMESVRKKRAAAQGGKK